GKLVDVVVNGDYRGCYQLCDHIDVREGRVDINEMKATDISSTAITGGYLIEIDAYAYDDQTGLKFSSNRGVPVTMKNPDEGVAVQVQQDYIKNHFNAWESSIMSSNYTNPNSGFRAFTDIESFCRHFLIAELAGNTDTYWSVYMVKKRNNDKFFFGPIWDYDLAFENDSRTEPIMNKTYQNQNKWLYQWGGNDAHNVDPLIDRLLSDASLYQRLKDVWAQYRNSGAISTAALVQTIDNYAAQINVSQDLNFKRWDNLYNYEHQMWARGDYTNNINIVKNYVTARLAWMDTKLNYVPSDIAHTKIQNFNLYADNNKLIISNLTEKTDIVCFDLAGKKIFETSTESSFEKQLPQGVYIVQLTTKNNYLGSFKIVIGVMP
ncbi:MAG: CotH kinase family protein, partial [Prevotellaceae bacterium]|nr:CotH kinase family protein [Prevotellaceae bacterium]